MYLIFSLILLGGTVLAGWVLYGIWGHGLVEAIYQGRASLEWLNLLVKRQALHPLEYYLAQADQIVEQSLWLSAGVLLALGAYGLVRWRWPTSPLCQPIWGVIWIVNASLWLMYAMQVPLLLLLPRWFWPLQVKALPGMWLVLPLAVLGLWAGRLVLGQPQRTMRNLLLLILVGWGINQGFAWMEGRGLQGMTHRLQDSPGHGRLARAAVQQESVWRVLTEYEGLVNSGALETFPHATRPPGSLLFIMLTERLAPGGNEGSDEKRLASLAHLAALLYPLLAYVVLVPFVLLCRLYMGKENAWLPAVFSLVVPNLVLMNLHLDQCLLPVLGVTTVYVWAQALRRKNYLWALGAGALWYMALFVSFALLTLALVLGVLAVEAFGRQDKGRVGRVVLSVGLGFGLVYGVFYFGFEYDAWTRCVEAMAAHRRWKVEDWGVANTLYYGGLNLLEFCLWCGVPVIVLAASQAVKDMRGLWTNGWEEAAWFGVALSATLGGLVVFGRTVGESGRLWLFLVPLVLASAAGRIRVMGRGQLVVLWVLQFLTVLVLKKFQDF